MKTARRCLAIWAAFALLPIVFVASVNFAVDPFQLFRVSNPPRFSNLMQRYQQPGVTRNYPFGSILVGNSLVGNLRTGMFREAGLGPSVQNLSFWGSTLREAAYVVDLALRTKPIDTVYWAIGRQWILVDYRYSEFPAPACMYARLWSWFPYCYLINADIFSESLAIALDRKELSKAEWVGSFEEWKAVPFSARDPQALACEMQRWEKYDDIDLLTRNARKNLNPVESPETARFREIVLPIVRANPQVRFKFILSPLHLWQFWFNATRRGELGLELAIINALIDEPNVEIHDMTAMASLTHDSARYDVMHYDFTAAREVVAALASGSMKITSLERHKEMLRNEIEAGGEMVRQSLKTKCP